MCANHQHDTSPTATEPSSADELVECPVMPGSFITKSDAEAEGWYRDHDGIRTWFCCDACAPLWDADPDRYATT